MIDDPLNLFMNLVKKIILKSRIETRFLLEQKWGIKKPIDPHSIPKYVLKKYLPSNPTIIDCGAHVGADSVELSKIFPKSIIHSFEPVPVLFNSLVRNTRKRTNIACHRIALSNQNGVAEMHLSSGASDASSSLLQPASHTKDHPDVLFESKIVVTTETIDDWAEKNNISVVDFLWLDMQGMEFKTLSASKKILSTVKAIHCEVSLRESYKEALVYSQFRQWLESNNFVVVMEAIPDGSDMGNVLFARSL